MCEENKNTLDSSMIARTPSDVAGQRLYEKCRVKRVLQPSFLVWCVAVCWAFGCGAQPVKVESPDGRVAVSLTLESERPFWVLSFDDRSVLKPSALGLVLDTAHENGFSQVGIQTSQEDNTWRPVWGRFSEVRNHYNEVTWRLQENTGTKRRLDIVIRVYNAGVGLRYKVHGEGVSEIHKEQTQFAFAGDYTCWSANGEEANIGPVRLSEYDGYSFPLTVQVDEGCYVSVLEAAIYDQAFLGPKRLGPTTIGVGNRFGNNVQTEVVTRIKLPLETSWRVVMVGEEPGDLLTGNLLENLNPACAIEDTSWIKPGLAMWDWRAWGGKGANGFVYNLDMASWRRMIDFASKYGIKYLVLDANWYGHEFDPTSNPMKSRDYLVYQPDPTSPQMGDKPASEDWDDPIDVPALIDYARKRDVGIFLYINDVARNNFDFRKTLATYRQWGAAGIKYGFMKRRGQDKVLATRQIVSLCAEYELMCDFHDGPVPPSGDVRTYPNYLSREFCHSQCDSTRSFTPRTYCTTVFCNMLAGPLDMCNGFMTLTDLEKGRPKVFKPVHSTVVAEAARVLITYSGLAYLPDTPESYERKADLFEFIARLPMDWDETRILNGRIGEHITTARRAGRDWFIASCCNEEGAELTIDLSFLKAGVVYEATLFEDTAETHFVTNKESYRTRKITLHKGDIVTAVLAPGGGHCMHLKAK